MAFNETNVIIVVFHGKFLRGFFDRGLKYTCKKGGLPDYFCSFRYWRTSGLPGAVYDVRLNLNLLPTYVDSERRPAASMFSSSSVICINVLLVK